MRDLNRLLRPKAWNDVVGQTDVKEICIKSISEGKFPKFSIFCGPTGVGKSCLAELIAMQLTGCSDSIENSQTIRKYNMATLVGKKSIVEIIDSIFKYKAVASGSVVYILEEVQVLKQKEEQTPFLEELTRIPDNVYIMMCTTKVSSLLSELRNRAVAFQLTIPTYDECVDLVNSVMEKLDFAPMEPRAMEVLIKASNYTPRSIIKHIELLSSSDSVHIDDVNKFFKVIDNSEYIRTLALLTDSEITLYQMVTEIKKILNKQHIQNFMYGLRDFAIQYLIECASGERQLMLSVKERSLCAEKLANISENTFALLFDQLLKIDFRTLEGASDTLAVLIKIKLALMSKSVSSILQSNSANVSEAVIFNKKNARTAVPSKSKQEVVPLTQSLDLTSFGIEDNTTYEE